MRPWITTTRTLAALLMVLALGAAAAHAESPPIDINEATAAQLTELPGVGPAIAARIVAFREEHGRFERVEDLMKVRGIGEKTFEKLRDRITVGTGR